MAEMRINEMNALYRLSLVPIAASLAVGATAATEPVIAGFEPLIARSSDAAPGRSHRAAPPGGRFGADPHPREEALAAVPRLG